MAKYSQVLLVSSMAFCLCSPALRPATAQDASSAKSPDELEKELGVVADQLVKFLHGSNEDSLSVGEFTGPPQLSAHAGPGIAQLLVKSLEQQDIRCLPRAKLGLQGKYVLSDSKARIQGELVDLAGKILFTFTRDFENPASFATLFGVTGKVDVVNGESSSVLQNVVLNPETTLNGARVFASPNSPYGVEICIKEGNDYVPRIAHDVNGFAFLKIGRGEVYAIRLINNSPHDAAIRVSIDGISVFAFSDNPAYKHFIVRAKQTKLIKGWHRTNQISDEFLVTSYSKSAVAEILPKSPSIGTITAAFAPAWAPGEEPLDRPAPSIPAPSQAPAEYRPPRSASAGKYSTDGPTSAAPDDDEPDATGRGEGVEAKYRELRRYFAPVTAVVTVRYTKETPRVADESSDTLVMVDDGDWLEIRARTAPVMIGSTKLLTLSAGDIVRQIGQQGEWFYVTANRPDGEVVNGFVYRPQAKEYSIPFQPK